MKNTAKSTQDIKAIKAALKLDGTIFHIKGQNTIEKNEAGELVKIPQEFTSALQTIEYGDRKPIHSFSKNVLFYDSMNVAKFGSTRVTLYTFTPFGKRITQTLYYSNITIVSVKPQPTESETPTKTKKSRKSRGAVINNMEVGGEA